MTELSFSDVQPLLLATGLDSGSIRLWNVPEEEQFDCSVPLLELRGVHKKKIVSLAFSPIAANVLASAGGEHAVVWIGGEPQFVMQHPAAVFSVAWSSDGALLLTTAADKKTRVWDPRSSVLQPVLEYASCHDGVKPASGLFATKEILLTAGFNKNRERQLQLWSIKDNKQLAKLSIDSGTGVLTLLYDAGSGLVFVSGKSDASLKVFELGEDRDSISAIDGCGDPTLPLISVAMLPKRMVSASTCEIARLYAVSQATSVVPISFVAPRKVQKFDPELFPVDAPAGVPACTAEEWATGFVGSPVTVSMDPLIRAGSELSTKEAREAKQNEDKNFRRWNESSGPAASAEAEYVAPKIDVNAPEVKKFESVEYKVKLIREKKKKKEEATQFFCSSLVCASCSIEQLSSHLWSALGRQGHCDWIAAFSHRRRHHAGRLVSLFCCAVRRSWRSACRDSDVLYRPLGRGFFHGGNGQHGGRFHVCAFSP